MHLLDGGVIKNYLEAFIDSLGRCPIDKKNPNAGTRSIVETEADKMVTFLKEFSLTEQARKLRYVASSIYIISRIFDIFETDAYKIILIETIITHIYNIFI